MKFSLGRQGCGFRTGRSGVAPIHAARQPGRGETVAEPRSGALRQPLVFYKPSDFHHPEFSQTWNIGLAVLHGPGEFRANQSGSALRSHPVLRLSEAAGGSIGRPQIEPSKTCLPACVNPVRDHGRAGYCASGKLAGQSGLSEIGRKRPLCNLTGLRGAPSCLLVISCDNADPAGLALTAPVTKGFRPLSSRPCICEV
jgi:hypothetical protein